MRFKRANTTKQQSGAALLLSLFALLLLSCIAMFLYLSSGTEARIATNYGSSLDAYYSAKAGIQEVRDRVSYPNPLTPNPPQGGGLATSLPTDIAGNANGVLYVLNPSPGEIVDPTNVNSRYFDDQLCHDYNSGVPAGTKCGAIPGTANWQLQSKNSLLPAGAAPALKWVRINMKTNRMVAPNYCVDQACASLDAPVCWDGQVEQVSPGGALTACDANGMQNVYMLTALAVTPGVSNNSARRLLRSEVVPPSIRPPGAVTMDAVNSSPTLSDGTNIPGTAIDGRPHQIDGTLITTGARCSSVAAVGTDNPTATAQFTQALNNVRLSVVQTANASCNWDGTGLIGNKCTAPLWWVRGNGSSPRFITTITTTTTSNNGHDGDHKTTTTTSPCDSSAANCYTNLDLGAQELYAVSAGVNAQGQLTVTLPSNPPAPFGGGPGNQQGLGSMYQAPSNAPTLPNEIAALNALVLASAGQANYYLVSSASLADTYGSKDSPVILKIPDTETSLSLSKSLTGFGVLVVPNDLEVNLGANLQWTGIVLVRGVNGGNAQFKLGGGTGGINGALLLQPSTTNSTPTANLNVSAPGPSAVPGLPGFRISYSCDAIDMAFGVLPFKVVSSSEASF